MVVTKPQRFLLLCNSNDWQNRVKHFKDKKQIWGDTGMDGSGEVIRLCSEPWCVYGGRPRRHGRLQLTQNVCFPKGSQAREVFTLTLTGQDVPLGVQSA